MNADATYTIGQKNSQGREIVAIENGKACVTDGSAATYRYAATRRWYKLTSPTLAAIMAR